MRIVKTSYAVKAAGRSIVGLGEVALFQVKGLRLRKRELVRARKESDAHRRIHTLDRR